MLIIREKKKLNQDTIEKFNEWKDKNGIVAEISDNKGIIDVNGWTQEKFINVAKKLGLDIGFYEVVKDKKEVDDSKFIIMDYHSEYEVTDNITVKIDKTYNNKRNGKR